MNGAPGIQGAHDLDAVYDAVLFDMDGVVTNTAAIHAAAWKQLFDQVLQDPRVHVDDPERTFDAVTDYRRYVDGRSREDGVSAYLDARGITLEPGKPDDPPEAWTVAGLAARKNDLFLAELGARGLRSYPGTTALLTRLRNAGVPVGLVTASRNARQMLAAAQLTELFDTVVDGQIALEQRLPGKPDPAMFLEAVKRLGVTPARAAVVEDAVSGIEAARQGGFGLVVGIARQGHREEFEAAGADIVLNDVGELDLGAKVADPWVLVYHGFDPAHEGHREALTALGNGYLVTRGARPEHTDDGTHYPGTYLAGVYNRLVSSIHGRSLEEEHLVNVPNWLPLDIRVGNGPWWSSGRVTTHEERREVNLRSGISTRWVTLVGPRGKRLSVVQRSFVSMEDPHLAVLETTVVALGWGGSVTLRAGVDAGVRNTNVAAYLGSDTSHLSPPTFTQVGDILLCEVQTKQSQIRIATAIHLHLTGADAAWQEAGTRHGRRYSREVELTLVGGEPATLTKTASIFTSRDSAIASPGTAAVKRLHDHAGDTVGALDRHQAAWERLWQRFAITIDADPRSQLVLNLHIFHVLQSLSPHTADLDAGVPARGLHGEGYRGHVFWDELFVLPVLGLRLPPVARALLDYRWHRLAAARTAAREIGLPGALFPWQSGNDGREETPDQIYNPRSARWMPDNSRRQRHVGLAVAYNAWQHYQVSADRDWLAERGAELIIEVARYFAASAVHDPATDRFHIAGVMGPDEYHDGYPDAPGEGVRDNSYTNVMVAWVCHRAGDALQELVGHARDDVIDRLRIDDDEIARWEHVSRRLAVPVHADGVLSQFDGYESLLELDWAGYWDRYGNIGRLDLILESENDTTNRYKLAKQPDVVMLVYLLGQDGLRQQLGRLGYPFSQDDLVRTVAYYLERTANGSTLSRVVNASVLAGLDESRSWSLFREALIADLDDTQGGTTREGIHLGAMAGTVDLIARSFAGLQFDSKQISFAPRLPTRLADLRFQFAYRGHRIDVDLNHETLHVHLLPSLAPPIRFRTGETRVSLAGDESHDFPLTRIPNSHDTMRKAPS
ncbi:beta-phosphoglucomutase family hydrolase [Leifsonia sp. H3M29-4]|uniref:beta-phosphoglucomutase family hydrolase n=1 Tax=Salinibacterium metalliresistens TaxID=3031321 RepID=UPI0023DA122D|nr:beta-phosphoglucomutase family hydrolase [Salinibacterium metalliresistens]MDF1479723.1 beta-phosphoglucomutase family hydrolase [Salinibacterium metalliresistens]